MKRTFIISFSLIFVGILTFFIVSKSKHSQDGNATQSVYPQLKNLKSFDLKQVEGSYFVLHFWAKWCEPCAEEIPHLVKFAENLKSLKILAVSLDPSIEESKTILPQQGKALPSNFILALDADHQVAESIGSYQYPESYLVDPQGRILEKWIGSQKWGNPEVLEFFKRKIQ